MLARPYRFHGYGSLKRTYQHGQSVRGPGLTLRFMKRPPHKPYRVAVVVSRKVSKSAVVRNRIRRRLYETVRQSPQVPPATDLVFTVFNEQLATLEDARLRQTVAELLNKAKNQLEKTA